MTKATLEMRVLQRAVELMGSERALARHLRISMPDLFMLLKGDERPTKHIFLEATDLLMERGGIAGLDELVPAGKNDADGAARRSGKKQP